jgi:hypothetical protein
MRVHFHGEAGTIVEVAEIRDSGRLSRGMTIDDRAAGEAGELTGSCSIKGASVSIRVPDGGALGRG